MKKFFLMCLWAVIAINTAKAQYYYDEEGDYHDLPADAITITESTTTLNQDNGWYYLPNTITITKLTVSGQNVKLVIPEYKAIYLKNLIIQYGASLTLYSNGWYSRGTIETYGVAGETALIDVAGTLNVCGGRLKGLGDGFSTNITVTGELNVKSGTLGVYDNSDINVSGKLNITGGNVEAYCNGILSSGSGTISITGGSVDASKIGGSEATIILGWSDPEYDYISTDEISAANISIKEGQVFVIDGEIYEGTLTAAQIAKLTSSDNFKLEQPYVPYDEEKLNQFIPSEEISFKYDGKTHEIINSDGFEIEYGQLLFSTDWENWSKKITLKDISDYHVYYMIKSNDNRFKDNRFDGAYFTVNILDNSFAVGDFKYAIIDEDKKEVCVRGFVDKDAHADMSITIPATVEYTPDSHSPTITYKVTKIDDKAFDSEKLAAVSLPEGLEVIGVQAFKRCHLTEITLPSTLKQIGDSAFHRQLTYLNVTCLSTMAPTFFPGECTLNNHPFPFAQCGTLDIPEKSFGYQSWFGFDGFKNVNDHTISEYATSMDDYYIIAKYEYDIDIPTLNFTKEYDGSASSSTIDENGMICGYPAKINDEYSITQITFGKSFNQEGILDECADPGEYTNAIVVIKSSITGEERTYQFRDKIKATITPHELDLASILANEIFDTKEYDGNTDVKYKESETLTVLTYGAENNIGTTISYILPTGDRMELVFKTNEKPTYDQPDAGDRKIIIPAGTLISISINKDGQNYSTGNNYKITGTDEKYNITVSSVNSKIKRRNINEWLNTEPYTNIKVDKSKHFDGTPNAQSTPVSPIPMTIWTRSEEDYDYKFIVAFTTVYVDADNQPVSAPGEGYSAKITFTIENDGNFCFVNEKGEEVSSTYKIIQQGECSIIGDKITLKDGIHQSNTFSTYCIEGKGRVVLKFTTVDATDKINYCNITVDQKPALNQTAKVVDNSTTELNIPSDIKPGKYNGKIVFTADEEGKVAVSNTFDFEINIAVPHDVIKQLYADVIFVDNKYGHYSKYQWCIGEGDEATPIKDSKYSNRQYYTEADRLLDDIYSVILTTTDGIELRSCPYTPDTHNVKRAATVTPYPNPAQAGKPFTLKIQHADFDNAYILIFNTNGALVQRIDNITEYTEITLPKGYYSGALVTNGKKTGFKIIVE